MSGYVPPTVESFAAITQRIIARDGFDDYLPTALYPARRQILVLDGVPPDLPIEPIVIDWALRNAVGTEPVLVAFKVSPSEFKVMSLNSQEGESQVFMVPGTP